MAHAWLYLLGACLLVCSVASLQGPQVTVEQGTLRGKYLTAGNGNTFAAFQGIPYAKSPVGKHRFKEPVPAKPWRGTWNAEEQGSACLQLDHTATVYGDEDCLFLNVYSPMQNTSTLMDVIFDIHGGAFMVGWAGMDGPKYLMNKNVVVVTINYRLGPLGFFSTGDDVVPGNNGLKDQSMALQWVKKNIGSFGGNPDKVTIIGTSAGGASVHYQYLSPLSKDLFHQGVSLSGTALCPWALVEGLKERGEKLGALLGCPTHTSHELIHCLRRRPARAIVQQVAHFMVWMGNPFAPWGPTVEVARPEAFLSEQPIDVILQGRAHNLPWVTGVTREEGLFPAAMFITSNELMSELDRRWDEILPALLEFTNTVPVAEHSSVAQKIKKFYLGDKPVSKDTITEIVEMLSDRLFKSDAVLAAQLQAKHNTAPIYFYQFAYRGKNSLTDLFSRTKTNFGCSHGDDAAYVFETSYINIDESEADQAVSQLMVGIWTDFAQTGNPSPPNLQWQPLKPEPTLSFLHIGSSTDLDVHTAADFGNRKFWDSLPINEAPINYARASHIVDEL